MPHRTRKKAEWLAVRSWRLAAGPLSNDRFSVVIPRSGIALLSKNDVLRLIHLTIITFPDNIFAQSSQTDAIQEVAVAQKYCRKTVDDQCISEGLDDYEEYWEAPEPEGEPSFIDDETSTQLYLAELAFRARCRANLREFLMEDEERLNEEMWAQAC